VSEFDKVAIANRGEVAVRIIRACQELGIQTVLLHSEADRGTMAYRMSDEQVCIGPSPTPESYLNIMANIQGALAAGADAIHPGFGFLSENMEFARACEEHRLTFIGPTPEAIHLFGDKISAKRLVEEAGAPVIPGYSSDGKDSVEILVKEVEKIGLPAIVKAAAGGGGRGLKVIHEMSQAREAIESAMREGLSAFGSDRVFLEKYLDRSKHIEVQIFGDVSGQVFHLAERECSVQRRHQKVIEEALSPSVSPELRARMAEAAVRIGEKAKYRGAGTVEFLLQDGEFYFLEMNTRLQVEHPVTELVMGVDLVKSQILVAQGQSVGWEQSEMRPRGHAIECRIYTEDPYRNGMPSTGVLGGVHWPHGPGRRFEVGFEPGDEVTSFYDSMIAKVIVWDESRSRAIQKMRQTLTETVIFGLHTNIPYLQAILNHSEFVDGSMTTKFIETHFPNGLEDLGEDSLEKSVIDFAMKHISESSASEPSKASSIMNPWFHFSGDQ
jgi:acetyl-CoA carboxylase biotin carboxylase subunit